MNNGVLKVASQLLAFFKTDPTATPWFLRQTIIGQPPGCEPSPDATVGITPLAVQFSANASDPDGTIRDYQWTFDDGTFSNNSSPVKTFKSHGIYTARVTVADNDGNSVTRSLTIMVAAVALGGALFATNRFQFAVLGATNRDYVVQQSENLAEWLAVATNRGPFVFNETNPAAPRRYSRALARP